MTHICVTRPEGVKESNILGLVMQCSHHRSGIKKGLSTIRHQAIIQSNSDVSRLMVHDTGTTEVFDPLLVRFRRPLVRPLIRSTRLHSRCWRPHPHSCRFATTIKTTWPTKERSRHAFGDPQKTTVRYTRSPVRYRYDLTDHSHDHVPDRGDRHTRHRLIAKRW